MDITQLEKLRPCGRLETYSTSRHHMGFYNNVGLAATYTASNVAPKSLETLIFAALREAISKHPNLSTIIVNEDKSFPDAYFARLEKVDLQSCVEFRARTNAIPKGGEVDKELEELLEEQHNRGYKDELGTKPFWRLLVLTSTSNPETFTAAWIFHHAQADGNSAFIFHNTLLAALNSLPKDLDSETSSIVTSPDSPISPPFEELHPMTLSWSYFIKTLAGLFLPSLLNKRPEKLWTGSLIQKEVTPLPRFRFRNTVLCSNTTKRLAEMSRKEQTTVTATLQSLLAVSLFDILSSADYDKVKIVAPMAMRRFINVKQDQMINAVAQYDFLHKRSSPESTDEAKRSAIWQESRLVKARIDQEVAKEGRDSAVALLKYVSNMHEFFTSQLGKPRGPSAEISNIGIFRLAKEESKEAENWRIGRMTFSQCSNPTSCAFAMSVVTGGDGEASLSFGWCEGVVEDAFMEEVVERLHANVELLVQNNEG